jgi:hypothetical protein
MKQPSIGRIVHVVEQGAHWPAIITRIGKDGRCWLMVFGDAKCTGTIEPVAFDPNGAEDTWHWPEYVPDEAPERTAAATPDLPPLARTVWHVWDLATGRLEEAAPGPLFQTRVTSDGQPVSVGFIGSQPAPREPRSYYAALAHLISLIRDWPESARDALLNELSIVEHIEEAIRGIQEAQR